MIRFFIAQIFFIIVFSSIVVVSKSQAAEPQASGLKTSGAQAAESARSTEEGGWLSADFQKKHVDPFLLRATDKTSAVLWLSGAVTTLVARNSDDSVRESWKDHQKMAKSDARVGDILGTGVPSALIAWGQYAWDENENNYQSHLRGLVYGGLSIYSMKTLFGRNRPGNSDSHQSFPSGHTAITFMTATHLTYAYGWQAAAIAYPLAVFTGASRLADDAHWFSDLVGGAFLGVWVARASYYDATALNPIEARSASAQVEQKGSRQTQWLWAPVWNHNQAGIFAQVEF